MRRYLLCPDCHKRGVYWVKRSGRDDGYVCRYCDFECYCSEEMVDTDEWLAAHRLDGVNA